MDYRPYFETIAVALIGALPGLFAFLIQRRESIIKSRRQADELHRLKDTSIVQLVDPLTQQVAYLSDKLKESQTKLEASERERRSQAKRLARVIVAMVTQLESFRDEILEIHKDNGNGVNNANTKK